MNHSSKYHAERNRQNTTVATVVRTLKFAPPVLRAIIQIVQSTGARPNEVCQMKVGDIDRTNTDVWFFKPQTHKAARLGEQRAIAFGREEQAVLAPYLEGKSPKSAVFSPKDTVVEHKKLLLDARTTPFTPSQKAQGKQRKRHPRIKLNEHFTTDTVGRALKRAIHEANGDLPPDQQIPEWTLCQLRHELVSQCSKHNIQRATGHGEEYRAATK